MKTKNRIMINSFTGNRTVFSIIGCIILIIIFTISGCSSPASTEDLGLIAPDEDIVAPDFTLPTLSSGQVTLSDLQGKPVLLNFWYVGCVPCREEMPYLDNASQKYSDEISIITINVQDGIEATNNFFKDFKPHFIIALDLEKEVGPDYSIRFTPTTYLIDSEGYIRYAKLGAFPNEDSLMKSIEKLLEED